MASSRIFIKGLPPTLSESDFRKHFAQNGRDITDAKIFQNRRIGYVGYKTPEDAQEAVKYFNRTFMRMSKIGVEIARPIKPEQEFRQANNAPTARREPEGRASDAGTKRKRESDTIDKDDPKLKEFMEVMRPKSKKKAWEDQASFASASNQVELGPRHEPMEDAPSDDEYEKVPKKNKKAKLDAKNEIVESHTEVGDTASDPTANQSDQHEEVEPPTATSASDADWARSRTSRLLGLQDDDEDEEDNAVPANVREEHLDSDNESVTKHHAKKEVIMPEASMPTPPSDSPKSIEDVEDSLEKPDADIQTIRSSMRLFVRNLPYDVKNEDLEAEFASYGNLEEVRSRYFVKSPLHVSR